MTIAAPPSTNSLDHLTGLIDDAEHTVARLLERCGIYEDERVDGLIELNRKRWRPLDDAAQPLVKTARDAVRTMTDFAARAIDRAAPERHAALGEAQGMFDQVIEQSYDFPYCGPPAPTTDAVRDRVAQKLAELRETIRSLPTAYGAAPSLLVADTSALLDRPVLQDWKLGGAAVDADRAARGPRGAR